MIMFSGYILALMILIVFLIHAHHMKRDLRASYVILQETNGKLLAAKRERLHYKVAAELLMEEKNPKAARTINRTSGSSQKTSADFGSSRQDTHYSRQTSDDSGILVASVLATAGSSYDYGSSSCDSTGSIGSACD